MGIVNHAKDMKPAWTREELEVMRDSSVTWDEAHETYVVRGAAWTAAAMMYGLVEMLMLEAGKSAEEITEMFQTMVKTVEEESKQRPS